MMKIISLLLLPLLGEAAKKKKKHSPADSPAEPVLSTYTYLTFVPVAPAPPPAYNTYEQNTIANTIANYKSVGPITVTQFLQGPTVTVVSTSVVVTEDDQDSEEPSSTETNRAVQQVQTTVAPIIAKPSASQPVNVPPQAPVASPSNEHVTLTDIVVLTSYMKSTEIIVSVSTAQPVPVSTAVPSSVEVSHSAASSTVVTSATTTSDPDDDSDSPEETDTGSYIPISFSTYVPQFPMTTKKHRF